jgi:glycosyltransferase involved in cell wall biosynthesis
MSLNSHNIYFYPHAYLRERQLDVIRNWTTSSASNAEDFTDIVGQQVTKVRSLHEKTSADWKRWLPLLNIKSRPSNAPRDSTIYIWGGLIRSGNFIVDLDNPYSLVGFNLKAMRFWRLIIKRVLLSKRCVEIRCMSRACHKTLGELFGQNVFQKAKVHYPRIVQQVTESIKTNESECRFLFIATQFEIKGGKALLRAFEQAYEKNNKCRLDAITHLPEEYKKLVENCAGIVVHEPNFSRDEIHTNFMQHSDVLIMPTYVDSFGMVVLEALSFGLAIIANDVYAIREMVEEGKNGNLLTPPISIWDGTMPSSSYYNLKNIKSRIQSIDTEKLERELEAAMLEFASNPNWLLEAKNASVLLMKERFIC